MIPHVASDTEARRRIRESLDESLIVEASAGTGKTTELVKRIVAVLAGGRTTIDRIAAVTFTNKAAGDLKLRLREALDEARLTDALRNFEEASIGTIHSFCAQLLRERPVEARVDPAFEELSEPEAGRLYQRAFRAWLEKQLNQESPGLRRAFARLAWRDSWDDGPPMEQLQWAGWRLIEWRDYPGEWKRLPFARDEEIHTLHRKARELADASARPRRVTDALYKSLQPVRLMVQGAAPDLDTLEAQLLKLGRDLRKDSRKGSGEYGGGIGREQLVSERDELCVWLEDFRRKADADLAAALRQEMAGLLEEYRARKERLGKLDFGDLLILTRNLLKKDIEVRHYLQRRFTHLFVDEFQDTDPIQAEILLTLAEDDLAHGKLFLVGDPKQSIYKFRRADIEMYRQIKEDLAERGVGLVSLTKSFRSVPNIQQFVNAAFETEMIGDGHSEYSPLEPHRDPMAGRPSVIALPVPRPYKSRLSMEAVNRCLPDAIAAFIAWILAESGWGFKARDIAVLFRRRVQSGNDLTREYARALEARGVDHLLAGSKSFHRREEVETLRAALAAIEWPDDELSVFAALKGSLFAIPDETLLVHKHKNGRLHPFHREGAEGPVLRALEIFADLHRQRNYRPFAATVNGLLEATRAHAAFLLRPGGNQILANVARLADLARTYEMTGGVSFRGFVEELAAQAEKEDAAEAPVLEEDSDGVRLMTVHGAKGLEFPVVILADLTAKLAAQNPERHVDAARDLCAMRLLRCAPWELLDAEADEARLERAEGVRVAYVAATRARDLLVLPAVGDDPFPVDGWLSPLDKALYPARDARRHSTLAEGCPEFGASSVMERPMDYDRMPEDSVRPGLIVPQSGTHNVVWWDPHVLQLGAEIEFGLQETVLKKDDGASLAAYHAWAEARAAAIASGSKPRYEVFLASEASEAPPERCDVEYIAVVRGERPSLGRRFGTLVHEVLRDVELDAAPDAVRRGAEMSGRALGAAREEIDAASEAVVAALAHPLIVQARGSARAHREYPFSYAVSFEIGDRRLLEGVIDLAFVQDNAWTIVDFKTDADVMANRARYERQLQWYGYALRQLTGMPAKAVLLGL